MSPKAANVPQAGKTDTSEGSKPATMSIAPAMDLSLDAVTVPPPPTSAANSGSLGIPRAPRVPGEAKPTGGPAKPKRSEDDIFSIFDVEANTASDDIPVSVQPVDLKPPPAAEKPKSQLGTRSEEREVTRSRQIPIDQDLFNLSIGIFSNTKEAPLVAPDMSALVAPGLSEKSSTKEVSKSALDDLVLPAAPAAPLAPPASLDLLTPKSADAEPAKPMSHKSHKGLLFGGIAAAVLIAGGVFFYMQQSSSTQATASNQPTTTSTESGLDTRPGQTAASDDKPAVAKPETTPNDSNAKPDVATATNGTNPGSDKPTAAGAGDKPATVVATDKPSGQGKPSEPEATDKPAEPEAPSGPSKAQSLAEAMAAAAPGGGTPPATPPPSTGPEFNKAAASAALNGAAGAASGCKAPGDPAGVVRVSVTFAPSGRATRSVVNGPPYGGTTTGSCVAAAFRSLSVPPFSGDPVTVSKSVSVH